jgi:TM2 domain-containing membrane protein YozV/cold shock CspA family protein
MRGKVLGFDNNTGKGTISTDDGTRYTLTGSSLGAGVKTLIPGQEVDFIPNEDGETKTATDIFPLKGASSGSSFGGSDKSKFAAGLLAIFLGHLGIHKFYLGKTTAGIIQLLLGIFGWLLFLPGVANLIIAFIEGIIYLTKSDEDFHQQYVVGDKSWF